jgi:outer membrane receptor protein involved in Fe transport
MQVFTAETKIPITRWNYLPVPSILRLPLAAALLLTSCSLLGQGDTGGEVYELSPFEVNVQEKAGYYSTSSVVASGFKLENVKNPINITSLTGDFVADLKFDSLDYAANYIAGAQKSGLTSGSEHGALIKVRGIDTLWLNRNGIRRYVVNGSDNLERLEVVKGPAAVFFGQAAVGGVVNYVTKRPSFVPLTAFEARYGSYDYKRFEVESQGPIMSSQQLAYRVNASYLDKEDWRDFEWQERSFVYGGLLWQPSQKVKIYVEYERIKDEVNDALDLPQGNRHWYEDFLALPDSGNAVTDYYFANPSTIGLPSGATREEVIGRLQGRWRRQTDGFNQRWRTDSQLALGLTDEQAMEQFPQDVGIASYATPFGYDWNGAGPGGLVKHDLENYSIEALISPTEWFNLRAAVVWDNPYRWSFINRNPRFDMSADGPVFNGQTNVFSGWFNETMTTSLQGVFNFFTGPAEHTLMLGYDRFEDSFLPKEVVNADTVIREPSNIGTSWNYALDGYPYQNVGDARMQIAKNIGVTGQRTSYSANYIVRLWDSKLVGMVGIRQENFKEWGGDGKGKGGPLSRDTTAETPSLGLVYEIIPGFNLFASHSESFDAFNGRISAQVNESGRTPEEIEYYESLLGDEQYPIPIEGKGYDIGIKTNWRDNTISGSLAYFNIEESGRVGAYSEALTLNDPRNADYLAANPGAVARDLPIQRTELFGRQFIEGIELDLMIQPNANWMILVAYAHLLRAEANLDNPNEFVEIPAAARDSYSVWTKYSFREGKMDGLSLGFGFNGSSEYYLGIRDNGRNLFEDGYILFDVLVEYVWDLGNDRTLKTSLNVKNALDERYFNGGFASPGESREIILSARYQF